MREFIDKEMFYILQCVSTSLILIIFIVTMILINSIETERTPWIQCPPLGDTSSVTASV